MYKCSSKGSSKNGRHCNRCSKRSGLHGTSLSLFFHSHTRKATLPGCSLAPKDALSGALNDPPPINWLRASGGGKAHLAQTVTTIIRVLVLVRRWDDPSGLASIALPSSSSSSSSTSSPLPLPFLFDFAFCRSLNP